MGFAARKGFDEWARLAQIDPERFEAERREVIEEFISQSAPEKQELLRRFQWRIDQIRRQSATPLAACIKISDMMMDAFVGERGLLESLESLGKDEALNASREQRNAKILAFPTIN